MNDLLAHILEAQERLPQPPHVALMETGADMFDWLKAHAGPPVADPGTGIMLADPNLRPPLRPATLFGTPIVVRDDMDPNAWRLLDRDGQTIEEGRMPWLAGGTDHDLDSPRR